MRYVNLLDETSKQQTLTPCKVVHPTLTAYKRAEASVPSRITTEALAHYAELVAEVCIKSQIFDTWLERVGADGEVEDAAVSATAPECLLIKEQVGYMHPCELCVVASE